MAKVTLKNVKLGYKVKRKQWNTVVEDLNVEFLDHKVNVIVGESGCGKTSILRAVVGLLKPLEGAILFDDQDITNYEPNYRSVSYVSQMIGLYPNLSVFNNIAFPLKVVHCDENEIRERVAEVADLLRISHCLARRPRELSIGQAQRVAIARALVKRSLVYVFDEPFSNLDKELSHELVIDLRQIFTELRATVIFVSHDMHEAFTMADQLYVMHEGKIVAHGTPEHILKNKDERVVKLLEAES